uniref:CCHC-type domain-containing protein n=1 Tax=Astyanax mexicanus TaxID=7994 RepID=A0A3B1IZU5_ASTMX
MKLSTPSCSSPSQSGQIYTYFSNTNHVSGRARSKPKPKAPSQSGCYKCGAQGHIGRESNTNHVSGRARSKPKPKAPSQSGCYKCGAQGHIGRECIRSKNHKCSHCGKRGHFDDLCFHKDKYKSNQVDTPSSQGCSRASGRSRDDPNCLHEGHQCHQCD